MTYIRLILVFFVFVVELVNAQSNDTLVQLRNDTTQTIVKNKEKKLSKPARAALYSAILPGAGQFYNRSYWKVPIVYALIGGSIYMTWRNHRLFKEFDYVYTRLSSPKLLEGSHAYDHVDTAQAFKDYGFYSSNTVKYYASYHRDWRDKFVMISIVMYAANIIEAHVDAHLKDFNISEEVSMRLKPSVISTSQGILPSIELNFKFKDRLRKIDENSYSGIW